jgi:plasmid stability protein
MANVLIRDVPDEVHEALRDRAEREGQSLQQYLQAELARLAAQPSVAEVLDRIEARSGGAVGLQQAVDDLARERP